MAGNLAYLALWLGCMYAAWWASALILDAVEFIASRIKGKRS